MNNSQPSGGAELGAPGAAPPRPGLLEQLASGAWVPHIGTLLALAAALALGIGLILWASRPSFVPVFDQLNRQDAATITELLRSRQIPFEVQSGSGLILVPSDRLEEVRMQLAAEGIGENTALGLEMLQQDQGLGTSRFIENARYQHALETELARTIAAMRGVDTARVHLALPKQSVFIRNRAKPSASVMVKMSPGRTLQDSQVAAIVHMVASSVPYLEPSQVTIVDQWGRLLSSGDGMDGLQLSTKQFEYTRKLEDSYAQRIEELLSPIVGAGRVRAQVSAEVDFSATEQTQELYDGDPKQVRSEQVQRDESKGNPAAIGVPGALSNQPPGAGTTDPKSAAGGKGEQPTSVSESTTRNYELDKTIRHVRAAPGKLRRLSVAVVVDNKVVTAEDGTTSSQPLSEEELATLTRMVKEAVGFNAQRGDSVAVFNQPFQPVEDMAPLPEPPLWKQPWFWSLARQLVAGIAILLLILFVARPAVRNLTRGRNAALPGPADGEEGAEGEQPLAVAGELADDRVSLGSRARPGQNGLPQPPEAYGDVLDLARNLAAEDPKRVAKVLQNWVGDNV